MILKRYQYNVNWNKVHCKKLILSKKYKSQQYIFFSIKHEQAFMVSQLSDGKTLIFKGACFFLWK